MRAKLAPIVAAAVIVLAVGSGAATAYTMAVSPAGEVEIASNGKVTFEAGEIAVECDMTFHGELNETVSLSEEGESLGEFTAVEWANCEGGAIGAVLDLSWDIAIGGVLGTLPNAITGILVRISKAIRFSVFRGFINCLYQGETGLLWGFRGSNPFSGGSLTWLGLTIAKVSGTLCPRGIRIHGSAEMEPEQEITII